MLIGLKLDVGFSQDEVYRRLYGERDILAFLRELGFDAVETPVGPETQTDELREHIARCVGAGLKVSLHPYSEGTIANPLYFSPEENNPCRRMHQRFFTLAAEAARLAQYPTIVNIHGAAGTDKDPREFLVERTIAFFTWAGQWCRQNAPEVGVTVELQISPNADEPRQRIGDKYEELLEIAPAQRRGRLLGLRARLLEHAPLRLAALPARGLAAAYQPRALSRCLWRRRSSAARLRRRPLARLPQAPARPRLRRPGDPGGPPRPVPQSRRPAKPDRLRPSPEGLAQRLEFRL